MKILIYTFQFFILLFIFSCKNESNVDMPIKEEQKLIVMTLNLKDDSSKIAEYVDYHKNPWPEVEAANKKAGITDVKIYKHGRRLMMVLQVPKSINLDEMSKIYAACPRMEEWAALMKEYQESFPETPDKGWIEMELIHDYQKDEGFNKEIRTR